MQLWRLFYVLFKLKVLSPVGLYRLVIAIRRYGINLMMLLSFTAKSNGDKVAIVDDDQTLTYHQLLSQSENLAKMLKQTYGLTSEMKVAFLCRNHASFVKAIFATSRLGSDIYLLNTQMSNNQFQQLLEQHDFDFLIYDVEVSYYIEKSSYRKEKLLSYHDRLPAISNLLDKTFKQRLEPTSSSNIMLLTGGTTGKAKQVAHKPSIFHYLTPFLSLLTRLQLPSYQTAYIATPIYHGYGIAVLLVFIALGKKVIVTRQFDSAKACHLIREHHVEVVTVVPLMIRKMLTDNSKDLRSLACIASGGAVLHPNLVKEVFEQLGDVLYNLYGTSEAGLNVIATPKDLKYSAKTIGKKIRGTRFHVLDETSHQVAAGRIGKFCIKNSWSMRNKQSAWIETGDIGYQDKNGYYFLCGRSDDMIVSAGENVYPIEVEQVLINHPKVEDVAVIGIADEAFGQRLKAFIQLEKNSTLTKEELMDWLRLRVARYQLPKEIVFLERMPYTPLGKLDKKQLK